MYKNPMLVFLSTLRHMIGLHFNTMAELALSVGLKRSHFFEKIRQLKALNIYPLASTRKGVDVVGGDWCELMDDTVWQRYALANRRPYLVKGIKMIKAPTGNITESGFIAKDEENSNSWFSFPHTPNLSTVGINIYNIGPEVLPQKTHLFGTNAVLLDTKDKEIKKNVSISTDSNSSTDSGSSTNLCTASQSPIVDSAIRDVPVTSNTYKQSHLLLTTLNTYLSDNAFTPYVVCNATLRTFAELITLGYNVDKIKQVIRIRVAQYRTRRVDRSYLRLQHLCNAKNMARMIDFLDKYPNYDPYKADLSIAKQRHLQSKPDQTPNPSKPKEWQPQGLLNRKWVRSEKEIADLAAGIAALKFALDNNRHKPAPTQSGETHSNTQYAINMAGLAALKKIIK